MTRGRTDTERLDAIAENGWRIDQRGVSMRWIVFTPNDTYDDYSLRAAIDEAMDAEPFFTEATP